jgi:hypothetical protein
MNEKECTFSQKKVLADGTIKYYEYKQKYMVKGYTRKNGEVTGKLTEEQKVEIRRKASEGVTIKRLCEEYKSNYPTIKKLVPPK